MKQILTKISLVTMVGFIVLLSFSVCYGHDDVIGPHFGGDGTVHDNGLSIESLQPVHIVYDDPLFIVVTEGEITKALQLARKHLTKSTWIGHRTLEYRTPADELRKRADEIEEKDADIDFILDILERLER